ncbi:hypothetical protein ACQEU8_18630 [Streptomyces sp. CA-250714]|uniref:hypothetical protein n=1 Tax=Streptomyces sp. CA-250714 TaxID=3240060 RepID=UPI003D948C4D
MNEPTRPQGSPTNPTYVLTDAFGRQHASLAPARQTGQVAPHYTGHACACDSQAPSSGPGRRLALSPGTVAVGVAGALVVGSVLVALLLSVAMVALAVATTAVSVMVCALVLRSMAGLDIPVSGSRKHRR